MKVENIEVEFFIDYLNKRIHVLEKGRSLYNQSLPNIIGTEFQKSFIEQQNLLIDVMNFEWFCYCSNGLVLLFKGRGLNLVSDTSEMLYKPFLDALRV